MGHRNNYNNKTKKQLLEKIAELEAYINEHKPIEKSPQNNEQQFKLLVENANEAIAMLDANHKISMLNNSAAKYLRGKPEDFIGKTFKDIFPKKLDKEITKTLKQIIKSGEDRTIEIPVPIDDEVLWFRSSLKPITDSSGKVTSIISLSLDITDRKNAEDALKESEEKFRIIFENANDEIVYMDKFGKILNVNKKIKELFGYDREEVIGKNFTELSIICKKDLKEMSKRFQKAAEGAPTHLIELEAVRKDGSTIFIESSTNVIKKNDEVEGILTLIRDISERKKTENRILRLNETFLNLTADYDNNINEITKTCGELFGAACAMYNRLNSGLLCSIGQWNTPDDYNPEDIPDGHICYDVINAGKGEVYIIDNLPGTKYFKSDPNVVNYELKTYIGFPVYLSGQPVGSLCAVFHDDVEFDVEDKKLLGILAKAISSEEERKRAGETLNTAKIKAEESGKLKSAFIANLSHEIRTPLNTIIGYTDLLINEELSYEHVEYLENIKDSGRLLLSIINDILDLSKIEADQVEIDQVPFSLSDLFKRVDNNSRIQIFQMNREIALNRYFPENINRFISGDPIRLQQVMSNLMTNAVKFTDKGSIEYGVRLIDENTLEFYVSDTGIGIPKKDQKNIFESFRQSDFSTTRKHGGTGLGLTITKRLIELMGGKINLLSKTGTGHGSAFTFTFPYIPAKAIELEINDDDTYNDVKEDYNILLVEDYIENQKLFKRILEKSGFNVITEDNGQKAISKYKNNPSIDLILMDVQMPILDGLEATKQIRAIEKKMKKRKIPIIALTAVAMKDDMSRCISAGCDDYIAKPINYESFLSIVKKHLNI